MIDLVVKEHVLNIASLGELLRNNAEFLQEQMPGHHASSLSKWINRYIERDDFFYDSTKCKQLARLRSDMYIDAVKAYELFRSGKKDEALNVYQKVRKWSDHIESLLKELQEGLQKNL